MRDPAVLADDIRDHLNAENAAADAWFAPNAELQRALVAEMRGRIKEDDSSVPAADGPFLYFTRFREGGQHPLICRRPAGAIAGETIVLDGDAGVFPVRRCPPVARPWQLRLDGRRGRFGILHAAGARHRLKHRPAGYHR